MFRKRVGITTDVTPRERFWRGIYGPSVNFKIEAEGLSYEEALKMENKFIKKGYTGNPGGDQVKGKDYFVYTFVYVVD